MIKFLIKRSLLTLLMLFGLLTITFFISRISPGDPAALAAGPDASAKMIEIIRKEYGLDRPIIEQYLIYVKKVLQGDWGKSIHSTHEVLIDLGTVGGENSLCPVLVFHRDGHPGERPRVVTSF